jgi:hypothetical protein
MPKKTPKKSAKSSPAASPELGNVTFNLTLDGNTFARVERYKAAKALLKEQEVVRIAIGHFLDNQGY